MRSTDDLPPSTAERYACAQSSENLRLGERRGDVDLIIAAGLVRDPLASAMYRLQAEYDGVRAEHYAAEARLQLAEAMAAGEVGECDDTGETAEERATKIRAEACRRAVTDHAMILMQLKSLGATKELFGAFAVQQATRRALMIPDRDVLKIAGRVLDVWMRPLCHHCDGRGTEGGEHRGEALTVCRPCRGSGHRRDGLGHTDVERGFAGHLLAQTDAMLSGIEREISGNRAQVDEAKWLIFAAYAAAC